MAINKIEIQDSDGNIYYPHTDASVVKIGDSTVEDLLEQINIIQTAGGSATAITLTNVNLVNGFTISFLVAANNNGAATTINGKNLYKFGGTAAPTLIAGKVVTVWYNGTSFFIKASAEGDAVAANVLAGKKFSNDSDTGITGTMVNNGPSAAETINITSEGGEYTIPTGYHSGLRKIKATITNIAAAVIKAGVTVGGIAGAFTADATALASQMLEGVTAYVNGNKITGTIVSKAAATYTPGTTDQTIAASQYLSGAQTVKGDANLVTGNIKSGASIFGVAGKTSVVDTADAWLDPTMLVSGYSGYDDGILKAGTMVNRGAAIITPGTANQAIQAGYHNGSGYIQGDANLLAANILSGKSIFGVAGTAIAGKRFASGTINLASSAYVQCRTYIYGYKNCNVTHISNLGLSFTPKIILFRQSGSIYIGVYFSASLFTDPGNGVVYYTAWGNDFWRGVADYYDSGYIPLWNNSIYDWYAWE